MAIASVDLLSARLRGHFDSIFEQAEALLCPDDGQTSADAALSSDNLNLSDDVIGYTGAPAIALDYPWTHLISGHLGRVATREDVAMHQQYIADIEASSREALASVNPGPIFKHYGENVWAAVRAHLDAVTEHAAAPVIAKYTGVLGGADIEIFTRTTTFAIMQSIRLDRGPSGPVHP